MSGTGVLRLEHFVLLECDPTVAVYEPFPVVARNVGETGRDVVLDSLATYRDGRKVASLIGFTLESLIGREEIVTWARSNGYIYQPITHDSLRHSGELLFNSFTLLPWLSDIHCPSEDATRRVLGALMVAEGLIGIGELAGKASCGPEETIAVVARSYVKGVVSLPEICTEKLTYLSKVGLKRNG